MAYNPSDHVAQNLPFATSNSPLNAKSLFYDKLNFKYRAFVNIAEVNSYFTVLSYRDPTFDVIINTGGTLVAGVITGGVNDAYWYKDGTANGNLVLKTPITDLSNYYTKSQVDGFINSANDALTAHVGNTSNPHSVTKSQVGLGNVDNTSDANKPISTSQASVNNLKADITYVDAEVLAEANRAIAAEQTKADKSSITDGIEIKYIDLDASKQTYTNINYANKKIQLVDTTSGSWKGEKTFSNTGVLTLGFTAEPEFVGYLFGPLSALLNYLAKSDMGITDGNTIEFEDYIVNGQRISSVGILTDPVGQPGVKAVFKVPISALNITIGGFQDNALRNFSLYNESGISIFNVSINEFYPEPSFVLVPPSARFVSFNAVQIDPGQPDPTDTLYIRTNRAIESLTGIKIQAAFLSQDNITPIPQNPFNATPKIWVEDETYNDNNSFTSGGRNLALQSDCQFRQKYVGNSSGSNPSGITYANPTGWRTWLFRAHAGQPFWVNGVVANNALYYTFLDKYQNPIVGLSPTRFNDGVKIQPFRVYPPQDDCWFFCDVERPGAICDYSQMMVNYGSEPLPFQTAYPKYFRDIGGYPLIPPVEPYRLPTFSFIVDDNGASDAVFAALMDSYNIRCGYALVTNYNGVPIPPAKYDFYRARKALGDSMLGHSMTHRSFFNATITAVEALAEMQGCYNDMYAEGIAPLGWVTPESEMRYDLRPLLPTVGFEYGYTDYFGSPYDTTDNNPLGGYQKYWQSKFSYNRVSMEGASVTGTQDLIDQVDAVIANNGLCCFYGHGFPGPNMTEARVRALIEYILTQVALRKCQILSPDAAVAYFTKVDHQALANSIPSLI